MLKLVDINYSVNNQNILKDISFEINQGDFLTIVGPNGSGKSTLIKIILGIINNYTGNVIMDNNISIGYVPQFKTFDRKFPATAIELVMTGITRKWSFINSNANRKKSLQTLALINATHIAKKQIANLSGGELQKIFLARAIVNEPQLLLLDEPITGLDATSETDIQNYINNLKHTTIIMVSHNIASAKTFANKLLLINKKIIYFGNTENINDEILAKTFIY